MSSKRIKLTLFIFPALVIGGFETFRHTLCIPYLSMETGNWLTALLAALIVALISRRLFSQFEQTERDLSSERETRAVFEERERIARELHDRIAQSIFYIGVQINSVKQKANFNEPGVQSSLNDVLLALREMDENVRQSIFNLRQDAQSGAHFVERVENYLKNAFVSMNVTWELDLSHNVTILQPDEQVQLFGILQEAITNIRKHAKASHIKISLETSDNKWTFQIFDDGVGFDVEQAREKKYGLDIIFSRAADIGAKPIIQSSPNGTMIQILKEAN